MNRQHKNDHSISILQVYFVKFSDKDFLSLCGIQRDRLLDSASQLSVGELKQFTIGLSRTFSLHIFGSPHSLGIGNKCGILLLPLPWSHISSGEG